MGSADAIAILILLTIVIAIGVYLLHWLYRHSSKDRSFVRTGLGGERVVMGGGAFIVPIVHNVTTVNMNAVPIEIRRSGEQSLITRNKMRIDVIAEFDVRVTPTEDGVSTAARTLGERTDNPSALKEIVQGRFIDAMSAIAATLTMEEIHTDRLDYMAKVTALVEKTMGKNGLELENASLTSLNQTDISIFNPDNAFDAEGLTQLTEQIETRRRLRNDIENEARIAIKLRDYEAEQRAITIDRDLEFARLEQARDVERRKSVQIAEIEEERSNSTISITNAKIRAEQESERIRIAKEKAIDEERISSQNHIRILEIQKKEENELQSINTAKVLETQRILNDQEVAAERIDNQRRIKEYEIRSRHDISIFETNALAEADTARHERLREVESIRIESTNAIEILSVEKARELRVSSEQAAGEEERALIARRYSVDKERLSREEEIARLEIVKDETIKLARTSAFRKIEDADIVANRELDELRIAARNYVERFEIEQRTEVEIIDKERLIAVINKSIEEAVAKTEAAKAEKAFARMEAEVASVKALEIADRNKRVELLEASSRTERETLRITSHAEAEKKAAEHRAAAEIAEANAAEVRYEKDADGARKLNEAENMRNSESRRSAIYEHLVKSLPSIIRETVKPMENIDSIKILQVDGLPGINSPSETGSSVVEGGGSGGGNMTDRVVNSAMKYRTQVAFVDGLMKDLGLPIESLGSVGGMSFRNFAEGGKSDGGGDN